MMLSRIWKKWTAGVARFKENRSSRRQKESALRDTIEQVVQASNPVICTLKGDCRKTLRSPVENALAYVDQAVSAIPGPIELATQNWDRDPHLKALFVNPDELSSLLRSDAKLKSFFANDRTRQVFGLLTATKKEKIVFGTAIEGEIVRRDVPQTAVEFYDHRIVAPGLTALETRNELRERALNGLVSQVLEKILKLRTLKDELLEQQSILSTKLKIQQTRNRSLDVMLQQDLESEAQAEHILADIDRQIKDIAAESDSPEYYLSELTQILSAPQEVLVVTPISLRLNWMGIKQCETSNDCLQEIRLADVELKDHFKRVAVLVTIKREDVCAL